MQPRLKTSKKWTPLPSELMKQIQSVFSQGFKEQTKGAKVEAQGRIYPEEIVIAVGLKFSGVLRQTNWQISIAYVKNKDNVLKLLHTGVDVIGALFEQSFSAENDHDFPRIWEEVDFEGRKVFVQYSTANNELEAAAEKLLGENKQANEDVTQGDWEEDLDPETLKAALGINPEDLGMDEDFEEPQKPEKPAAPVKSVTRKAPPKKTTKH